MFYQLSEQITNKLQEYVTIPAEDRENYRYGVQQSLILLLNLFSTLVISILCGTIAECTVYLLVFIPLRSYAGGYHARTHAQCYICSMILITIILLTMKSFPYISWIYEVFSVVGIVFIFLFSPVEDTNKQLDELETIVYRKKSLFILTIISVILILSFLLKMNVIFLPTSMALVSLGFLVVVGKVKNKMHDSRIFQSY